MASSISDYESRKISDRLRTPDGKDNSALDPTDILISVTYRHLERAIKELYG
jgi:hypothetical protein